jgi:hypothetical protein
LWPKIQHPDYAGITLADALEQEQLYLMPMPAPFDGYIEVLARVRELEAENAKLKRMYADLALENAAIKDVLNRKF